MAEQKPMQNAFARAVLSFLLGDINEVLNDHLYEAWSKISGRFQERFKTDAYVGTDLVTVEQRELIDENR